MKPRRYQSRTLDDLWSWFGRHPDGNPIVGACVGAGKSLMIAMAARRAAEEYAGTRSLVLVHQKELLEQNASKVNLVWPGAAGVYSAAVRRRELGRPVTLATIGSIWKRAHELGPIHMVHADECHLINTKEIGMWRSFLKDLARYNPHTPTVGWTGTDFRGNGVYLTAGKEALFTGVATRVTMKELLTPDEDGNTFLSPLTPVATETHIDTEDVRTSAGEYVTADLAQATDQPQLVEATCEEIAKLGATRRRWLVFAVTVEHAKNVAASLARRGVSCGVVHAETPAAERDRLIDDFRTGRIRCLVNVAVLTTGFDVPEVDFIALLRATLSPVLYVQIAGRGMRQAPGKVDCLWADFTDTTDRMGPVDEVKGRAPRASGTAEAPFRICPNCGSRNQASARECIDCGHQFPEPERIKHGTASSGAAVLSSQLPTEIMQPVERVSYMLHQKPESPPSVRVEYWQGVEVVAKEWLHFDHQGYPRLKAEKWWRMRSLIDGIPRTCSDAIVAANAGAVRAPSALLLVKAKGKHPEITNYLWQEAA